jgi:hypothetical protein
MKLALFGIIAAVLSVAPAHAAQVYKDSNGIVWTIEGPAVGRWRPFPDAARRCPSHHVTAEPRKLYAGGYRPTRQERKADKAAGVETMHIKCLDDPAPSSQGATVTPNVEQPRPPAGSSRPNPNGIIRANDEESL